MEKLKTLGMGLALAASVHAFEAQNTNLDVNGTLKLGEKNNIKGGVAVNGTVSDSHAGYPYTKIDRARFSDNDLSIYAGAGNVNGLSKRRKVVSLGKAAAFKQNFNILDGFDYQINKRHSPEATRIK